MKTAQNVLVEVLGAGRNLCRPFGMQLSACLSGMFLFCLAVFALPVAAQSGSYAEFGSAEKSTGASSGSLLAEGTAGSTAPAAESTAGEAPALRGALPAASSPGGNGSSLNTPAPSSSAQSGQSKSAQELLPADTIPLGVDEFENVLKPLEIKGPVGSFVKTVNELTPSKPCINCTGVQIKIQNLSPNPIIVDGEHAQALGGALPLRAISEDNALKTSGGTFTKDQKALLAAVYLGTFALAEPILQDHFSTSKKDFPVSYGVNETRRRLEDRRMFKRIILPGEDTEGIIFFPGTNISFSKISIPVKTYPQGQAVGYLDIFGGANQSQPSQLEPPTAGANNSEQTTQDASGAIPSTNSSQRSSKNKIKDRPEKNSKKKEKQGN